MKKMAYFGMLLLAAVMLAACGAGAVGIQEKEAVTFDIPDTIGRSLTWKSSLELDYAAGFAVDYYTCDKTDCPYKLLSVAQEAQYLVIPQGEKAPEDVPDDIVIVKSPQKIYLVASQVMDMFTALGAMERLRFSALDADSWYIREAKEHMADGSLLYAGKYSAPDYELILEEGCDLAIENTMIYHTPQVKEKLESFGIPVIVDRSSYEEHPLGRTEWVKLYGALTNREKEAEQAFLEQVDTYRAVAAKEREDAPTVAFFYIAENGSVKVRKSKDYLPKMIEMAGGRYLFEHLGEEEESASSTVNMQMEEFYAAAKDADYFIYNSTIEGELKNVQDLLDKSELLAQCKAVREGNVYCTSQNLYQSTMELGTIISDINRMLTDADGMTYIYPLK